MGRLAERILTITLIAGSAIAAVVLRPEYTAEEIAGAVLESRATSGFRAEARLTSSDATGETTTPLVITGRGDGSHFDVLYRQVTPPHTPRRAILIRDSGDGRPTALRFEGSAVNPIATWDMREPLFDSDLALEDVFESFLYWPSPVSAGDERIDGHQSAVIDFRPPFGTASRYSRVRAWIATDVLLPLRIEGFDAANHRESQLKEEGIVKEGDRFVAAQLLVEPDARRRTVLEITSYDRHPKLAADAFTVEAIARGR